jgi:hypothetical protein
LTADTTYNFIPDTVWTGDTYYVNFNDTATAMIEIRRSSWAYALGSAKNWTVSAFDNLSYTQIYTAIEPDKVCDVNLVLDKGSFLIEYFEMNATLPTRQKIIFVKPE